MSFKRKNEKNNFKSKDKNIGNAFVRFFYWFRHLSNAKHIFIIYFLITIIASLLLFSPISQVEGTKVNPHGVSYINCLFTSASAFSDTGLVTNITGFTWNMFGQAIIAIIILVGGFGFFALKTYIIFIFLKKRRISLLQNNVLSAERGSNKMGNTVEIVIVSICIMLIVIVLSSFILSFYFYYVPGNFLNTQNINGNLTSNTALAAESRVNPLGDAAKSIRYAVFLSISSINNAGFDILGRASLEPYFFSYTVQIILMLLFVLGGIGFPVIYDVYEKIRCKIKGVPYRFSLFTKISTITYFLIALFGLSMAFGFEMHSGNPNSYWNTDIYNLHYMTKTNSEGVVTVINNGNFDLGNRAMGLIFNTMSTRNAGFSSINLNNLTNSTLLTYSLMMFIGSAPSSTAGGIRTVTLALVVLAIYAKMRGRQNVRIFKRRIEPDTLNNAFKVVGVSVILCLIGVFIVNNSLESQWALHLHDGVLTHREPTIIAALFEVTSAFGTTGLGLGNTPNLDIASKLVLIFIMFIGQLGVSSTLLVGNNKKSKSLKFDYIKEDITIG